MPNPSTISLFSTLANMCSLRTSSFIGEFLISIGAFQKNSLAVTLVELGMILGAAYPFGYIIVDLHETKPPPPDQVLVAVLANLRLVRNCVGEEDVSNIAQKHAAEIRKELQAAFTKRKFKTRRAYSVVQKFNNQTIV
ncbi:hypothetical protein RJ641_015682 [Dillenia turbinata]|uniref:Uncharacterized protein n=1 Tax=Dillenia turbinata TaxID=194707 RepID=A0AAN8UMR0_9MAGN